MFPSGCWVCLKQQSLTGYLVSHPWSKGSIPSLGVCLETLPEPGECYYIHDLAVA